MGEMIAIKKVLLNERHLRPGRTEHSLCDNKGKKSYPPFSSLEIAQHPGDQDYYLLYLCENGQVADTWHQTLEDALQQAEFEFDVKPEEWT
jgi:hypothetical protein